MGTAFVTGGSGFVGERLIRTLVGDGEAARALARSDRSAETVEAAGATPVRGDLGDVDAMAEGMRGCDAVFHAAAKVAQWGRWRDFEDVNVRGTERVLEAARRAEVPRVVHASTEAVLVGRPHLRGVDESVPPPRKPMGPYGRTKEAAERRVRAAADDGLETVIVRPRFVWGTGDRTLLPALAESVRKGQFMWMAGGRYRTSTTHVDNVVEGLRLAAEHAPPGSTYFVTDGEPLEFRRFVTELLATRGVDPGTRSVPRWVAWSMAGLAEAAWTVLPLSGEPPMTRAIVRLLGEEVTIDDGKARRELGYEGRVTVDEGLEALRREHDGEAQASDAAEAVDAAAASAR